MEAQTRVEAQETKKDYGSVDMAVIMAASLYCSALIVLPLKLLLVQENVDVVFDGETTNELGLLGLIVAFGVLGSSLRSVGELIVDVGKRKFDRSWTLSYLIRPFEGAGMATVVYLTMRAGIGFLDRSGSDPSPLGFLVVAALSGMFAHKAAKGLAERMEQLVGKSEKPGKSDKPAPAAS